MDSQRDLIHGISAGDSVAFAALYDQTSAEVFGLLLRMMGDRADAEDVLQETYLQVWKQANRYDPDRSSPMGWLVTIARSRAIDHLRRRNLLVQSDLPDSVVESDVSRPVEQAELAERTRQVLASLPVDQRTAIELAFFGGLTYEQVALAQGAPVGTTKTRIRAGLQRLREAWVPPEGTEL